MGAGSGQADTATGPALHGLCAAHELPLPAHAGCARDTLSLCRGGLLRCGGAALRHLARGRALRRSTAGLPAPGGGACCGCDVRGLRDFSGFYPTICAASYQLLWFAAFCMEDIGRHLSHLPLRPGAEGTGGAREVSALFGGTVRLFRRCLGADGGLSGARVRGLAGGVWSLCARRRLCGADGAPRGADGARKPPPQRAPERGGGAQDPRAGDAARRTAGAACDAGA